MTIDKNPEKIKNMFNEISEKYDLINNIMSFGLHKLIKKECIKSLDIKQNDNVLDLCCGTGDLSRIIFSIEPNANITGVDFSEKMLEIAKNKFPRNLINYQKGDATKLNFGNNSFDFVVMGFGLRNIENSEIAIQEIYRVLKPNGIFLHLDFGEKNFISKIFNFTTQIFAKILTTKTDAYDYLISSKTEFAKPEDLIKIFEENNFKLKEKKNYLFNVISSQIMIKN